MTPVALPPAARYRQAPMLDAAEYAPLPPVDERLPLRPMVLGTEADVGAYGGVMRWPVLETASFRPESGYRSYALGLIADQVRQTVEVLNAHKFFAYDSDLVLHPWLLESWEYDGQGVWSLHLREGLRWSDGEAFTLQDVRFALDHNPDITAYPEYGDTLRKTFEVVDDYVLRVHSTSLDALDSLARITEARLLATPSHYVQRVLPEVTEPEQLEEWAAAALRDTSPELTSSGSAWSVWWRRTFDWRLNPELPSLNPWVLANSPDADVFTYRRNPYCWLVDVQGNQLPYLDEVTFTWIDAADLRDAVARGEPDVVEQGLSLDDYAWLTDNLDHTTYRLHACPSPAHLALQVNLSSADSAKRAFANDRRVRQAISYLIDRERLNLFYFGNLLVPRQLAPVAEGAYASDDLAGCFLAYDPAEANRLLDEAGYTQRDEGGFRLFADGERIFLVLLEESSARSFSPEIEFLAEALAEGGIECRPRAVTQEEFVMTWGRDAWDALYGRVELPVARTRTDFGFWCGRSSVHWYGRFWDAPDDPARHPPEGHFLWSLWTLYEQYMAATTEDERIAVWQEAMKIWRQELPAIGVLGEMPRLVVARKGLRGLDPTALYANDLGGLGGGHLPLFHYGT